MIPQTEILERVRTILRRDLKLGADAQLPDDMPFFGGDVDLDSLDMLLLVTSIEREFGIKIPSEAVGKDVFQNIATLSQYIQNHAGIAGASAGAPRPVTVEIDPLAQLPHADPFRFVTKINHIERNVSAEGQWSLTGEEYFFAGHFPGRPIVPGVLIGEALAQLSGLVAPGDFKTGKLAHIDVRFEQSVAPPATILLKTRLSGAVGELKQFEVSAVVAGVVVARGNLALHYE